MRSKPNLVLSMAWTALTLLGSANPANADEGGVSFWLPGQ